MNKTREVTECWVVLEAVLMRVDYELVTQEFVVEVSSAPDAAADSLKYLKAATVSGYPLHRGELFVARFIRQEQADE